jgi:hypothetical protein
MEGLAMDGKEGLWSKRKLSEADERHMLNLRAALATMTPAEVRSLVQEIEEVIAERSGDQLVEKLDPFTG